MKKSLTIFILFLFGWQLVAAQNLEQLVSLNYDKIPLGAVLRDISNKYEVFFSYSPDFIPVDQPISLSVENYPLYVVLDELFEDRPVIYKAIAGQIVLRLDRAKQQRLDALALEDRKRVFLPKPKPVQPLPAKEQIGLPGGNRVIEIPVGWMEPKPYILEESETDGFKVRVGLMSFFKERSESYKNKVSDLSVNILWGESGNVNGMEVGGLLNKTHHNVKGVQIAGLSNIVNDDVVGTQVSMLGNVVGGNTRGVQVSGGFNLVGKNVKGIQVAGVFNYNFDHSDALQVAGLFNNSRGSAKWQIASLFNKADSVKRGQISLVNIGKRVDGVQVGLLNIADTTSRVSIGLLTINKKGYNRVEISGGDALHANFAFKPGVAAFYNIFQVGAAWNKVNVASDEWVMSWGLGYGFGSSIRLGRKTHLNIEGLMTHINEDRKWTKKMNLLNQFRLSFEFDLGRRTSLFFGPTGYLMLSKLTDTGSEGNGSIVAPPKVLWEKENKNTNLKAWVGFNAGMRF